MAAKKQIDTSSTDWSVKVRKSLVSDTCWYRVKKWFVDEEIYGKKNGLCRDTVLMIEKTYMCYS